MKYDKNYMFVACVCIAISLFMVLLTYGFISLANYLLANKHTHNETSLTYLINSNNTNTNDISSYLVISLLGLGIIIVCFIMAYLTSDKFRAQFFRNNELNSVIIES